MKKLMLAVIAVCMFTGIPNALSFVKPERRDQKLASQAMIENQVVSAPVAADDDSVLLGQATSASAPTLVASGFLAQPDVCRALSVTPKGTTADVPAGDIVVTGTSIIGGAISESFTLTANQSSIQNGLKAFCTVSQIFFPIQDGASATYDIGIIEVLGLKRCMEETGDYFHGSFGGAKEATEATLVADDDEVEKNTADLNSALDGSSDVEFYFVQNFRCLP